MDFNELRQAILWHIAMNWWKYLAGLAVIVFTCARAMS
jgi:hypothetical protein